MSLVTLRAAAQQLPVATNMQKAYTTATRDKILSQK
ncbi:hypothetical protein FHW89_000465 [Mucilaginibacter sp. SG564]|nr:hypothetical protein [Mucilaginibacter sp. SG564]